MIVEAYIFLAILLAAVLIYLFADWKFRVREKWAKRKRRKLREKSKSSSKGKIVGRPPLS